MNAKLPHCLSARIADHSGGPADLDTLAAAQGFAGGVKPPTGLPDVALLTRMANEFFAAVPGQSLPKPTRASLGGFGASPVEAGGDGCDLLVGDQGAPTGQVPLICGTDVLIGGTQGDRMQGFSGDDIMLGEGGFDKFEGGLGFDWASFEHEGTGVSTDMNRKEFIADPLAPGGDATRDVYVETEAVSGSRFDDVLFGTNDSKVDTFNQLVNTSLIFGLADGATPFFAPGTAVAFSGGNIMLGGDGNDRLMCGDGNDRITDFDAGTGRMGGEDRIDLSALGISAGNFSSHVTIADVGSDTLVTIDHNMTIRLHGIQNAALINQHDFILFAG